MLPDIFPAMHNYLAGVATKKDIALIKQALNGQALNETNIQYYIRKYKKFYDGSFQHSYEFASTEGSKDYGDVRIH